MSRENKLKVLGNKKAKPSGYCFCMDTKILGNFQICISVYLMWALLRTTNFSHNLTLIKRHICTFCQ